MIIDFHKNFTKQASKLKPAQKELLKKVLLLFQKDPNHPDLYNHPLIGQWKGYRSIAFGGDWRIHYKLIDKDTAYFVAIGTHAQLYK